HTPGAVALSGSTDHRDKDREVRGGISVAIGTGPRTSGPASWKALQKRILCGSLGIFCTYRNVRQPRGCGRSLLSGEGAVSRPAAPAAILPGLQLSFWPVSALFTRGRS